MLAISIKSIVQLFSIYIYLAEHVTRVKCVNTMHIIRKKSEELKSESDCGPSAGTDSCMQLINCDK